jgi:hypothetical protein
VCGLGGHLDEAEADAPVSSEWRDSHRIRKTIQHGAIASVCGVTRRTAGVQVRSEGLRARPRRHRGRRWWSHKAGSSMIVLNSYELHVVGHEVHLVGRRRREA